MQDAVWTAKALSRRHYVLQNSGTSKPPVKTRWLVTGALVPLQGLPKGRLRGAATNLRFKKTLEKQALNGSPLVIFQCVPALDMKMLLRYVPRPPTLTYVLLTYVLEMHAKGVVLSEKACFCLLYAFSTAPS